MQRLASQIRTLEADVAEVYELLAPRDNPTFTGTVSGLNKTMVGLSHVDDTSDADKPISTKTREALDLKANAHNPTFTGTVSGIDKTMVGLSNVNNTSDADKPISSLTQTALILKANATDVYTKGDTDQKIANLIDSAPDALNTLNELARAINNDAAYATNIVSSLAAKADKENPILTGTVKVSDIGGFTTESKARLHVLVVLRMWRTRIVQLEQAVGQTALR